MVETFHTPMGTATRIVNYLFGFRIIETFLTPMGTATRQTPPHGSDWRKHFVPLWGQQRRRSMRRCISSGGNISYPYGDSNHRLSSRTHGSGKHFIPLWGQQQFSTLRFAAHGVKHFIPLWGQQRVGIGLVCVFPLKHFIPLRGQQLIVEQQCRRQSPRNISYPSGDSNL